MPVSIDRRIGNGPLRVSVEASERRHLIVLEGELDLASARLLTSAFEAVLPHANAVVLDLDRLSFIDSSGLVAVLSCEDRCRQHGVGFAVTEGSPPVRRLFDLAGVTSQLPVCGHLRSFDAPRRRSRRSGSLEAALEARVVMEARRLRTARHDPLKV